MYVCTSQDNFSSIEPYAKFMLACAKTESKYGKQLKQSDEHGVLSNELVYDPPTYYGFVLVRRDAIPFCKRI